MTPTRPWRTPTLLPAPHVASITARQADVLAGICCGHSNEQIADRLWLSEQTVKTHVKAILAAFCARNRAHAAALAASGQLTVHVRGYYEPARRRAA